MQHWRNILEIKNAERIRFANDALEDAAYYANLLGYPFFTHHQKVYRITGTKRGNHDGCPDVPIFEPTGKTVEDLALPDIFCVLNRERTQCATQANGEPVLFTDLLRAQFTAERCGGVVELFFAAWPELNKAAREKSPIVLPPGASR